MQSFTFRNISEAASLTFKIDIDFRRIEHLLGHKMIQHALHNRMNDVKFRFYKSSGNIHVFVPRKMYPSCTVRWLQCKENKIFPIKQVNYFQINVTWLTYVDGILNLLSPAITVR